VKHGKKSFLLVKDGCARQQQKPRDARSYRLQRFIKASSAGVRVERAQSGTMCFIDDEHGNGTEIFCLLDELVLGEHLYW
jgi:hypothetical protein